MNKIVRLIYFNHLIQEASHDPKLSAMLSSVDAVMSSDRTKVDIVSPKIR